MDIAITWWPNGKYFLALTRYRLGNMPFERRKSGIAFNSALEPRGSKNMEDDERDFSPPALVFAGSFCMGLEHVKKHFLIFTLFWSRNTVFGYLKERPIFQHDTTFSRKFFYVERGIWHPCSDLIFSLLESLFAGKRCVTGALAMPRSSAVHQTANHLPWSSNT